MSKSLIPLLDEIFAEKKLLYTVLSSPQEAAAPTKIVIRPVSIQQKQLYQITEFQKKQTFHRNLSLSECQQFLEQQLGPRYHQGLICTPEHDYHLLISKKGKITILSRPPSRHQQTTDHNRKKSYLLQENVPNPFLEALGIMNAEGKVFAKKSDKFRQLNRFLEMVNDVLPHLDKTKKIQIIDFGCGKAALSFALYHFLKEIQGFEIEITGLDLKEKVIQECQHLAEKLGYQQLHFQIGDISHYAAKTKVDMVITLHACDTATDAALEKAVKWEAEVILSVPCCQHELYEQIKNDALKPLLKHGILRERFAALATDAARAQLLEILGYQTQLLEFIEMEHTPKNLLIRAIKKQSRKPNLQALEEYLAFKKALNISPALEKATKLLIYSKEIE